MEMYCYPGREHALVFEAWGDNVETDIAANVYSRDYSSSHVEGNLEAYVARRREPGNEGGFVHVEGNLETEVGSP